MKTHNSDYSIERFSMGRLQGAELADFEVHLLQCSECQDAVCRMDLYLQAMRGAAEQTHARPVPGLPALARLQGEYLLVKATLPNTHTENIGVLLLDGSDRLYCRFRRDFDVFVAQQASRFAHLPNDIQEKANELGARECLKWLQSTFSTVQTSAPMTVLIGDYATTVDRLYTKHIHPNIMRFCTHLPRYSLEAAAGKFGKQMAVEPEGWVEVRTDIPLTGDMFVTHVIGPLHGAEDSRRQSVRLPIEDSRVLGWQNSAPRAIWRVGRKPLYRQTVSCFKRRRSHPEGR